MARLIPFNRDFRRVLNGPLGGSGGLVATVSAFTPGLPANTKVATLNNPFGVGTVYTTYGTTSAQLQLVGNEIRTTSTPAVDGASYSISVLATSADGKRRVGETITLTCRAAAATGPEAPSGYALLTTNGGADYVTTNGGADYFIVRIS